MDSKSVGNAIRKMALGCIISEYGALEIKDEAKYELRQRVNATIRASNSVQDYFRHRHDADPEMRNLFKRLFGSNEQFLITEILVAIWDFDEDSLESLLNAINENKQEGPDTDTSEVEEMPDVEVSRCCGRCDGVNDICVADMVCEPHNEKGCEICYGPRVIFKPATPESLNGIVTDQSAYSLDRGDVNNAPQHMEEWDEASLEKLQAYTDSLSAERPASSAPVCTCEELSKNRKLCPVCDKEEYDKTQSAMKEAVKSNNNENY